jgi:DME family drug/metabolite transporter
MLLGYQGVSGGDSLGVIAAVIAAIAGAAFTLTVKRLIDSGAQSDLVQAALFSIAGVAMLSAALFTQPMRWVTSSAGIALAAWLGLVTMAAPNYLWVRGLGALSPGVTATLLLGEPLMATVLGVVVLGESLTFAGSVGLVLVLIGLVTLSNSASSSPPVALHE